MVLMKITNQIELQVGELPGRLLKQIEMDLTITNPDYIRALRQGRSIYGKSESIEMYRLEDDVLIMPRGYGWVLRKRLQASGIPIRIQDDRLLLPHVKFQSSIKLRDYQYPAVDALVKYRQGGVVAGCGAGKTMIMLQAMARIGQPSLWITHTSELLEQVIERACAAFDITRREIGIIGGGKFAVGERLTVAMIQTLAKVDFDALRGNFGAVFIDEAHHLAAQSFFHPVGQFPAMYRIWASATPERSDGLTEMVFAAGGPIVHTVDRSKVPTITPDLQVIETDFDFHSEDYLELFSELVKDQERNMLIARTIAKNAKGNYCLVLSDRIEHLNTLYEMVHRRSPELRIEILTGSMKKRERNDIMERVQNREVDVLMATQIAREGLDIRHLNRLFVTTPKRAAGAVVQEVGRIMRPEVGKTDAIVFDFFDVNSPILRAQCRKRQEVYRNLGIMQQSEQTRLAR